MSEPKYGGFTAGELRALHATTIQIQSGPVRSLSLPAAAIPAMLDRIAALEVEREQIRAALKGYADSDLASLAEYYARHNDALEQENGRLQGTLAASRREVDWLRYYADKVLPDDEPDFTKETSDAD